MYYRHIKKCKLGVTRSDFYVPSATKTLKKLILMVLKPALNGFHARTDLNYREYDIFFITVIA